jgi:transcriptional regulator with XRE-family HTH domain
VTDQLAVLTVWADAYRRLGATSAPERRSIREAAGITRARLAELLGVSPARIEAYERGALPHGEEAASYAGALTAMAGPEPVALDEQERAVVLEYFEKDEICQHCKGVHTRACPRVKSVEYHEGGTLARVEYWPDGDWPTEHVIFRDGPELA